MNKFDSVKMKAKKYLFLVLVLFCMLQITLAFSQNTITVIGKGTTKEEAIQDALRSAVEKATGVFVYSVTEVENFKIVKDKLVATSKGYVKDYKILDEKTFGEIMVLTVNVTVDVESLKKIVRQNIKAATYDDILKDYNLIVEKQQKLKKAAELLEAITTRPVEEMYSIDLAGYEVTDIGMESVKGNFLIRIVLNPFFWDTYKKIAQEFSSGNSPPVECFYGKCKFSCNLFPFPQRAELFNKDTGKILDFESFKMGGGGFELHPDIASYVIKPRQITLKLMTENATWEFRHQLYFNLIGDVNSDFKGTFENRIVSFCEVYLTIFPEGTFGSEHRPFTMGVVETNTTMCMSGDFSIPNLSKTKNEFPMYNHYFYDTCYFKNGIIYKEPFSINSAEAVKDLEIDMVVGPALGGVILSQWTAHHLSEIKGKEILGVYTEKSPDGGMAFTRGYDKFIAGKKVLVVEDLTTTGGSAKKVAEAVRGIGGDVAAV